MDSFTRWLASLPPVVLYGGFALVWVGATVLLDAIVRARLRDSTRSQAGTTAAVMLAVLGNVYAILLAFVVVTGWTGVGDASADVVAEASALVQVHQDVGALPTDAAAVRKAVVEYAESARNYDFPAMERDGRPSERTTRALNHLFRVMEDAEARAPSQSAFYREGVSRLNNVVSARRARIDAAAGSLPDPLYGLLVFTGLCVLVLACMLDSRDRRTHVAIVSIVAIVIASLLALVVTLDHPFNGGLHASDEPLREGILATR